MRLQRLRDDEGEEGDEQDDHEGHESQVHGEARRCRARRLPGPVQHEGAQHERDGATHAEREARHLDVEDEEDDRDDDQCHARPVDGQAPERDKGEDERDHARHRGHDRARVVELGGDRPQAEDEQEIRDVGVDQGVEELLGKAPGDLAEGSAARAELPLAPNGGHPATVELVQEVRRVAGDQVDHAELEGLTRRHRYALPHRLLRPLRVAAAPLGERADVGGRIVYDLLLLRVGNLRAADRDGVGRADVGARRHRGHVGGQCDEDAGRARARARRRHVHDHGHRAPEDRLHDLPHRGVEAARRVHPEDHGLGATLRGLVQRAVHEAGDDRVDHAPHVHEVHGGLRRRAPRSAQRQGEREPGAEDPRL